MDKERFTELSVDDLWRLYEDVIEVLENKIIAEKQTLEAKLVHLRTTARRNGRVPSGLPQKRTYPRVLQKYQNPEDSSQTWSGRGKQPMWVSKLLRSGVRLDKLIMPEYRAGRRRSGD